MTAARYGGPQRLAEVLQPGYRSPVRADVLQHAKLALRIEHPVHLRQAPLRVSHRAEHQAADDGLEHIGPEGETLSTGYDEGPIRSPATGPLCHAQLELETGDVSLFREQLQVPSGATTEIEDTASGSPYHPAPPL